MGLGMTGEMGLNQCHQGPQCCAGDGAARGPTGMSCLPAESPVLNPVGLWQQCQNQREEGSSLPDHRNLGGQEGRARDTSSLSGLRFHPVWWDTLGWGCCRQDAGRHLGQGHGAHF